MARKAGVGPAPLAKRSIDARRLGDAIRELVSRPEYATAAAQLQQALAKEDGVEATVAFVARHLERPKETFWTGV